MLGTLMKYELKSVGRIMVPIYGAFIVISILFGISLSAGRGSGNIDSFMSDVTTSVTGIVYVLIAVAVFVVTVMMLLQRFYINLLGSEGYLCFTLPVNTNAHIANKMLSAVIWTLCGAVIAAISAVILLLFFVSPGEIFAELGRVFDEIALYFSGGQIALYTVEAFVCAVLVCGLIAAKIYASIAAGQIWANHRVLGAVAAYIAFGIAETILLNIVRVIGSGFNVVVAFDSYNISMLFISVIAVQAVLIAAYWAVTYVMLDRKLNLQ